MYHHLMASYNVLFLFWLRQAGEHLSTEKHLQRYKGPPNVLVKIWICDPEAEESSEKHRFHHLVPVKNNLLPLLPSTSSCRLAVNSPVSFLSSYEFLGASAAADAAD